MAFEVPVDNFDPDKFDQPAPGRCHMLVDHVDEDGGDKGEMIVDFEVAAHTVPGQEGKKKREYFAKTPKAFGRIHQLAIALGMISSDQLKQLKAQGKSPNYDFPAQIGKQCHIDLQEESYEGKTSLKAGFRIYRIDDPKCAAWPKNAGMLKQAGIIAPPVPAAPATAASGASPAMKDVNLAGIV